MKNILVSAIVLFFISLNVNGQVSRDTLYLKNGYKAAGKLLGQSKTECRCKRELTMYKKWQIRMYEK